MWVAKLCGHVKAVVDSSPPRRNMKNIDLLFTSDSSEHTACDVSVAALQSQYAFFDITLTCKEKEKHEKKGDSCHIRKGEAFSSGFRVGEVRQTSVFITSRI